MTKKSKVIETRIGELVFDERGMPTPDTVTKLFDELDFQYAVQSYIWSLPIVGTLGWQNANHYHGGTGDTDMVG